MDFGGLSRQVASMNDPQEEETNLASAMNKKLRVRFESITPGTKLKITELKQQHADNEAKFWKEVSKMDLSRFKSSEDDMNVDLILKSSQWNVLQNLEPAGKALTTSSIGKIREKVRLLIAAPEGYKSHREKTMGRQVAVLECLNNLYNSHYSPECKTGTPYAREVLTEWGLHAVESVVTVQEDLVEFRNWLANQEYLDFINFKPVKVMEKKSKKEVGVYARVKARGATELPGVEVISAADGNAATPYKMVSESYRQHIVNNIERFMTNPVKRYAAYESHILEYDLVKPGEKKVQVEAQRREALAALKPLYLKYKDNHVIGMRDAEIAGRVEYTMEQKKVRFKFGVSQQICRGMIVRNEPFVSKFDHKKKFQPPKSDLSTGFSHANSADVVGANSGECDSPTKKLKTDGLGIPQNPIAQAKKDAKKGTGDVNTTIGKKESKAKKESKSDPGVGKPIDSAVDVAKNAVVDADQKVAPTIIVESDIDSKELIRDTVHGTLDPNHYAKKQQQVGAAKPVSPTAGANMELVASGSAVPAPSKKRKSETLLGDTSIVASRGIFSDVVMGDENRGQDIVVFGEDLTYGQKKVSERECGVFMKLCGVTYEALKEVRKEEKKKANSTVLAVTADNDHCDPTMQTVPIIDFLVHDVAGEAILQLRKEDGFTISTQLEKLFSKLHELTKKHLTPFTLDAEDFHRPPLTADIGRYILQVLYLCGNRSFDDVSNLTEKSWKECLKCLPCDFAKVFAKCDPVVDNAKGGAQWISYPALVQRWAGMDFLFHVGPLVVTKGAATKKGKTEDTYPHHFFHLLIVQEISNLFVILKNSKPGKNGYSKYVIPNGYYAHMRNVQNYIGGHPQMADIYESYLQIVAQWASSIFEFVAGERQKEILKTVADFNSKTPRSMLETHLKKPDIVHLKAFSPGFFRDLNDRYNILMSAADSESDPDDDGNDDMQDKPDEDEVVANYDSSDDE